MKITQISETQDRFLAFTPQFFVIDSNEFVYLKLDVTKFYGTVNAGIVK